MQNFRNPFERTQPSERKYTLPVKALSEKLKNSQPGKTIQYFVKSVSSMPLANDTSKQEIRLNYLHGIIEGRTTDNRYGRTLGQQQNMSMGFNNPTSTSMAPSQVSVSPFSKSPAFSQPQQQYPSFSSHPSTMPSFQNQRPNSPQFSNSNPFMPKLNQFQSNNSSSQPNKFTGMNSFTTPGLTKQTSFGQSMTPSFGKTTGLFGNTQSTQQAGQQGSGMFAAQSTTAFGGMNSSVNPLGGNTSLQAPGQLTSSPSFGTINQATQPQTGAFGQPANQPQQSSLFGQTQPSTVPTSNTNPLQFNPSTSPLTAPNSQSNPNPQPQQPTNTLDQNIKQLLESKPNLWNILALDPQYQHGFNESGRMYVKSVLQRIIDQNILSEQSMNKVIIEIYKQMYGADNFEKLLESRKKEILSDDKISNWKISELLGKEFSNKMTESVFPKDIDSIGQDFYRSFKRRSTKFFDEPFISVKKEDEYERRLERKFFNIKRPSKNMELVVKFVQVNRPSQERTKVIENPYTSQGLDKISEAITQIRNEHRRQIMPTQDQLPNIQGFTITPSLHQLKSLTRYQLLSVPKVTIANEWGSIRFKAPISLLNKNLAECLTINQRSVEIVDEQWKVRDAEIMFKKFADFSQLNEDQQEALEDKIVAWCDKEKFELMKVDRVKGLVVIQV